MFGLEKGKRNVFQFDLEKELKNDRKKRKETLERVENRVRGIKETLRKGERSSEDFDKLGILLRGYTALTKVIEKACL